MVSLDSLLYSVRGFTAGGLVRLSRSAIATWLTALAFIVILVTGWIHAKATIESQLREHVVSMAQLAADRTALTFEAVGKALQTIGDGMQSENLESPHFDSKSRMALQTMLIRARGRNPSLVSLFITDPAGRVLAASPFHSNESTPASRQKEPSPFSQNDRDTPSISTPFRDPANGAWLVRMTHRIHGQDGLTVGMLVADVSIDKALVRFFIHYPLDDGDIVSLHDAADRQLAAFPDGRTLIASPASEATGAAIAAGATEAVRYLTAPEDEGVYLVASRKLLHYPFYVVYGKNVDAWLLRWHQEQFVLALAALAALIVTAAITAGIQRRLTVTGQLQKVRGDLEDSNTALRATLAAAEMLAAKDQLTGLCNRRNFDHRLEAAIARSARHGDIFSLLMIDIDHFKNINDYYGHATGDDVLRRFGEVLNERLRQNDVAARWGGEEFVILADGTNLDNARLLAEQVRESVAMTPFSPVPRVTVSIGIAEYQEGESGDDLLRRADKALYSAKRNGRNRVIAAEGGQLVKLQSA